MKVPPTRAVTRPDPTSPIPLMELLPLTITDAGSGHWHENTEITLYSTEIHQPREWNVAAV